MANKPREKALTIGLQSWLIFSAILPALILMLVFLLTMALPWVSNAFLFNFGTGDAALLAGLICVGVTVDWDSYVSMSGYSGGRMTAWKNCTLVTGILCFVLFGACKVYGLYVTADANNLAEGSENLTLIANGTIAALMVSIFLGLILKILQITDAILVSTKQARP